MTKAELSATLNPDFDFEIAGSVEGMPPGWELASALAATDLAEVKGVIGADRIGYVAGGSGVGRRFLSEVHAISRNSDLAWGLP